MMAVIVFLTMALLFNNSLSSLSQPIPIGLSDTEQAKIDAEIRRQTAINSWSGPIAATAAVFIWYQTSISTAKHFVKWLAALPETIRRRRNERRREYHRL
jgi:hypothetical protein